MRKKTLWNKDLLSKKGGFNKYNYKDYLSDDLVLRDVLLSIKKHGAAIVEGVAADRSEIVKVCKRIGPLQNSHFGEMESVVTSNLEIIDRAYTSLSLRAHTDTAYLKNNAGLEVFHVINKAATGGESLLIDGFYCAEQLRQNYPKDFEFLTKNKVESQFYKKGSTNLKYLDQVIKLNPINGELEQIRFNPYHKVNLTHLSYDEIKQYYRAIKNLTKIVRDTNNEYWIGLNPDQILLFDNFRLLHGRSAFTGARTLVTAYLSRDDWLSKAEVLLENF